ncbi:unnamed protein product [Paramecium pentaurelia]|uniref:Uncharacterized protein n=1 Tax=Paramecium pentaurelia TaxID=43138 RepID=A0A8S1U187_9CILI|nr:unnamed protein product [Paramecium pentaurelia]
MAQAEGDQFTQQFAQASQKFQKYLENIITEQELQQTQEKQGEYEYEYVYE